MKTTDNRFISRAVIIIAFIILSGAGLYAREGARRINYPQYDIRSPGYYIVTKNLSITNGIFGNVNYLINVFTNDVTIDLNGFTLSCSSNNTYGGVIKQYDITGDISQLKRLTIKNGYIRGNGSVVLDITGEGNVLRDITIVDSKIPLKMGKGGIIENCIIGDNNIPASTNAITLGDFCNIRNTVLYGNKLEHMGGLLKTGEHGVVSRAVIAYSKYGSDTNAVISLINGAFSIYDSVFAFNEGGLGLHGVSNPEYVERTIFSGNRAYENISGITNSPSINLCTVYHNELTTKFSGGGGYSIGHIGRANNSISAKNTVDGSGAGDIGGFEYCDNLSGCVEGDNSGKGFYYGSMQYCIAYNNKSYGFVLNAYAFMRNCLSVSNEDYGIIDADNTRITDNHCSTNNLQIWFSGDDALILRNSVHGMSIETGSSQYGKIIEPAPGDEITTDISTANFRW